MNDNGATNSEGGCESKRQLSRKELLKLEKRAQRLVVVVDEEESDDELEAAAKYDHEIGLKMSVVGFDLSQDTFHVATIAPDKVSYEVVDVPAGILGKQRSVGEATSGKEGIFCDIMKLIGKDSPGSVQDALCCLVKNPDSNLLSVRLPGLDSGCQFTATHLLAMVLSEMKALAEGGLDHDVAIRGFCIGVPTYFSASQRLAVNQAAEIAGLHAVSIMNTTTAIALSAGVTFRPIWQKGTHIAIVDICDTATQVSIIHLKKKNNALKVISYAHDPCLGEDDFVKALLSHFGEEFNKDCKKLIEQSKGRGQLKLEFRGKQIPLESFAQICQPLTEKMIVLVHEAVARANLEKRKITEIILAGTGCLIRPISTTLQKEFGPAPKKPEMIVSGGVAMGCAMSCAIQRKKEFVARHGDVATKDLIAKQFLLDCNIIDKLSSSIQDESTTLSISEKGYGRFKLTPTEINAARNKEQKMLLPVRVRAKIDRMQKLKDFMQPMEQNIVNCHKSYLLDDNKLNSYLNDVFNGDGVEVDTQYCSMLLELRMIEERIVARKTEQDKKFAKIKVLRTKIQYYIRLVLSKSDIYSRVKQDAKDKFKSRCHETDQWVTDKEAVLEGMLKCDGPINFISDADEKIAMLEFAWEATLRKREPKITVISFHVVNENLLGIIERYRETIRTDVERNGCFMLPLQIEYRGVPNEYIHVNLEGREGEKAMMIVKRFNVYTVGFANMMGAIFELGNGRKKALTTNVLFPDGTPLNFHCDYFSMVDFENNMDLPQIYAFFENFKLDHKLLLDSIHVAAYYRVVGHTCKKCEVPGAIQRAVMRLSFMLNDTTRMRIICNAVHNGEEFLGDAFTLLLMEHIWNWGDISQAVREWDGKTETIPDWLKIALSKKLPHLTLMSELFEILYLILARKEDPPAGLPAIKTESGPSPPPPPPSDGQPGNDGDIDQEHAPPPSPAAHGDGGDPGQSSHGHSVNYGDIHERQAMIGHFKELLKMMKHWRRRLRKDCNGQHGRDGDKNLLSQLDQQIQHCFDHEVELFMSKESLKDLKQKQNELAKLRKQTPAQMLSPEEDRWMSIDLDRSLKAAQLHNQEELCPTENNLVELYEKLANDIQRMEAYLTYLELHYVPAADSGILAEIFAVFVDPVLVDEISCITVRDDSGSHIIYEYDDLGYVEEGTPYAGRGVRSLPYAKNKVALPLSGPWMAIQSSQGCSLEFFPKKQNNHGASDAFSRMEKDTTLLCLDKGRHYNQHDLQRYKTATFGRGMVHVSYAIWNGAVEAYVKVILRVPFVKRPNITGFLGAHHSGSAEAVSRIFAKMPSIPKPNQSFLSRGQHGCISMGDRFEDDLHSPGLLQLVSSTDVQLLQSTLALKLGATISFEGQLNVDGVGIKVVSKFDVPNNPDRSSNVHTQWIGCRGGISYQVSMHLTNRVKRRN